MAKEDDDSLRDRFAIAALQGLIAGDAKTFGSSTDASRAAARAYDLAEAMLAQRAARLDDRRRAAALEADRVREANEAIQRKPSPKKPSNRVGRGKLGTW